MAPAHEAATAYPQGFKRYNSGDWGAAAIQIAMPAQGLFCMDSYGGACFEQAKCCGVSGAVFGKTGENDSQRRPAP